MSLRLSVLLSGGLLAMVGPCPMRAPTTSDLADTARKVGEGAAEAQQKCEPLRTAKVAISEETEIGGAVALTWASRGQGLMVGSAPTDELNRYLNRVGKNLAAQSARPTLDWTFGVIDSDEFNAFSAPGGYIFVTRGLLKQVENEAQLAGVLGHEIAHVANRDALEVYNSIKANQCITAIQTGKVADSALARGATAGLKSSTLGFVDFRQLGAEALGQFAQKLVDDLTSQGFAHEDEFAADETGLSLVARAGYDPREYIQFLSKIPSDGGAFANHPSTSDRKAKLNAALAELSRGDGLFQYDPSSKDWKAVPLKDQLAAVR